MTMVISYLCYGLELDEVAWPSLNASRAFSTSKGARLSGIADVIK